MGKRHADILYSMADIHDVTVISTQFDIPYETIRTLEEIPKLDPAYIVIASNTALHYQQLSFLEKNMGGRKILVEKPLFDSFNKLEIKKNQVYLGYNLRFHPLIQLIKEKTNNKIVFKSTRSFPTENNYEVSCDNQIKETD